MTCEFAHQDGSYVLGALSLVERQEFEQHLESCAACARSVRELAGLPGLLARVDADVLEGRRVDTPVPDTLLPALVREVRQSQRRRTYLTAAVAAAAAVAITVGSLAAAGALHRDQSPAAAPPATTTAFPTGQTMMPVGHAPVSASVALESVLWGTRLDLSCTYTPGQGEYGPLPGATYALLVRTRDGRTEQVATWLSVPGKTMRVAAATAVTTNEITSVEVRTTDGKPVLKLTE